MHHYLGWLWFCPGQSLKPCLLHHTPAWSHRKQAQRSRLLARDLWWHSDKHCLVFYASQGGWSFERVGGLRWLTLFLKATVSVQESIFTVHQWSTCRALQRSGVKPCYMLWYYTRQKTPFWWRTGEASIYVSKIFELQACVCLSIHACVGASCRDLKLTWYKWFVLVSILSPVQVEHVCR